MNVATHPFDKDIAQRYGWPLVTRDGRKAEVLKWDMRRDQPLAGVIFRPETLEDWLL